jgi:hypothetical protein
MAWRGMLNRCENPSHRQYADYGARGIHVCDRWKGDVGIINFLADMGSKPSPLHSIDRIDNDKGYEPGNCRWATAKEQQRNKRDTRRLTLFGKSAPVAVWADAIGIKPDNLRSYAKRFWAGSLSEHDLHLQVMRLVIQADARARAVNEELETEEPE